MKISLFQGVLFGVFGLAAIIGLFVFANYTASDSADSVGSVTIWGTLPASEVQEGLVASVRADNTLKGVKYVEMPAASLATDLAAAIATGGAPDLILASQEEILSLAPFVQPIPLSTLPVRTFTDTFADGAAIIAAPGDSGYYGVPSSLTRWCSSITARSCLQAVLRRRLQPGRR
jgi:ABC-type glycerol-3-phosphate transport system substrate-binding protein